MGSRSGNGPQSSNWARLLTGVLAVALLAAVVAGCGGGGSSSSESSAPVETEESTAPDEPATGEEAEGETEPATQTNASGVPTVAELEEGTETSPPTTSPPVAKGKTVWWISCGQKVPDCSRPAEWGEEAAKKLGINFKLADGNLNEGGGWEKAIHQAIAGGASALIAQGIDCAGVKQALVDAKKGNVVTMPLDSMDCGEYPEEGTDLFSAHMVYSEKSPKAEEYWRAASELSAAWLIDETGEEAKVFNQAGGGDPIYQNLNKGFETMFSKCSACEVLQTIEFEPTDLVPGGALETRTQPALTKAAAEGLNGVYMPFDVGIGVLGGEAAVQSLGNPNIKTIGGVGGFETLEAIGEGKWDAAMGTDQRWAAWGAIDEVNRVLNGQEEVPEGVGYRLATKESGDLPPAGEGFESPMEWQSIYEKAWKEAKG
jgi:ribose transport system substrate-binding protein